LILKIRRIICYYGDRVKSEKMYEFYFSSLKFYNSSRNILDLLYIHTYFLLFNQRGVSRNLLQLRVMIEAICARLIAFWDSCFLACHLKLVLSG